MSTPHSQFGEHEAKGGVDLASEPDFQLGRTTVRPSAREVHCRETVEVLEPRVMQVLVALARQQGEVVSRDRLIELCWSGRVVGDDAIQRCVARIRRLADTCGDFTLDTIARVGYRLSVTARGMAPATSEATRTLLLRRSMVLAGVAGLLVLAAVVMAALQWRNSQRDGAQYEATLQQISEHVGMDDFGPAFMLARPLAQLSRAQSDPVFTELWQRIVVRIRPLVSEAGATVYYKAYEDLAGEWILAGKSPIEEFVEVPFGAVRIRVEKPGFRTETFAVSAPGLSVVSDQEPFASIVSRPVFFGGPAVRAVPLPLSPTGTVPDDSVLVPATDLPVYLTGWVSELAGGERHAIPAFTIARFEVSNREFKEFIDAGGYEKPEFWSGLEFMQQGQRLSWEEAHERFTDTTRRPGPSGWQLSSYPSGQGDLPVSGVSWYEAVAYARFREQSLPTIHHWVRAALPPISAVLQTAPQIAGASRFKATGPVDSRSETGLGPWGTYNMLGNVREWVANASGEQALALGSYWGADRDDSISVLRTEPMSRGPDVGIRLMHAAEGSIDQKLTEPVTLIQDTAVVRRPVSDEAFSAMRFQFDTARTRPTAIDKREVAREDHYVVEEITITFANESPAVLYISRPAAVQTRRLHAIVYGPGGNCCFAKRPNRQSLENMREGEFIVRGGRAFVQPIWSGAYERHSPMPVDKAEWMDRGRRAALAWQRDLQIALDYLESQPDFDAEKFGYLGYSRGAVTTSVALAVEPRIKVAVLVAGGVLVTGDVHPMIDIVNYAPRITIPVLMVNGRYDHHHPLEQSQLRLFNLLGTPQQDKRHILHESGHFTFGMTNRIAADTTDWLDKYLGPVNRHK